MSGEAIAKPRRKPASPNDLPNERSTTALAGQDRRQAFALAVEIGEGFVDDQHAAARRKAP